MFNANREWIEQLVKSVKGLRDPKNIPFEDISVEKAIEWLNEKKLLQNELENSEKATILLQNDPNGPEHLEWLKAVSGEITKDKKYQKALSAWENDKSHPEPSIGSGTYNVATYPYHVAYLKRRMDSGHRRLYVSAAATLRRRLNPSGIPPRRRLNESTFERLCRRLDPNR